MKIDEERFCCTEVLFQLHLAAFVEPLQKDLIGLVPSTVDTEVIAPAERQFTTRIGDAILSSLSIF